MDDKLILDDIILQEGEELTEHTVKELTDGKGDDE